MSVIFRDHQGGGPWIRASFHPHIIYNFGPCTFTHIFSPWSYNSVARCSAAVKKLIMKDWKLLLYLYINIEFVFDYVMTGFWTATLQRNILCEKISKIIAERARLCIRLALYLHCQNTTPTCGRKKSHVWPQKKKKPHSDFLLLFGYLHFTLR